MLLSVQELEQSSIPLPEVLEVFDSQDSIAAVSY
jgi:hypothetical protein